MEAMLHRLRSVRRMYVPHIHVHVSHTCANIWFSYMYTYMCLTYVYVRNVYVFHICTYLSNVFVCVRRMCVAYMYTYMCLTYVYVYVVLCTRICVSRMCMCATYVCIRHSS